ncbi:hypothetical protein BDY19DRAFT_14834 [Irpex rosettiformis]|uniref:Uncharacterized protein n=1 Tax=Irpex rosettiformis TaxID=378272 RepID=A0ACB8UJ96_9APHY|nr:hypothetical protein BDY19DRAFT_14834 [Irpex rosettiformis]
MSLPACLVALLEPDTNVSEAEYNDWADNEHIPARLQLPAFQNCIRWKAVDRKKPSWATSYDLTSYEETLKPEYTALNANRSARELRVFGDVAMFERRVYEAYEGNVTKLPKPSALYDPAKPAPFAHFITMYPKPGAEEEIERWYEEEHIPDMAKSFGGWIRSRRFILKDWLRGGKELLGDDASPPKFLAIHEYSHIEIAGNQEELNKFSTEWTVKVLTELNSKVEFRLFAMDKEFRKD